MEETTTTAPAAPVEGGAPASTGEASAPAVDVPVAAAPEPPTAAPEAAPAFTSADDWGWDEWDGEVGGLPEEVQGWYSRFSDSFAEERTTLEEQLDSTVRRAKSWEDMYNAVFSGEEDPRIAEGLERYSTLEAEFNSYKEQQEEMHKQYEAYVDKESTRYFKMVADRHPEVIEKLNATEGGDEQVLALMGENGEALEFEDALLVWSKGEEAVAFAQQAVNDGVAANYILDLVNSKFQEQAPPAAPAPKSQPDSVDLVTGSSRVAPKAAPPAPKAKALNSREARLAAAERAWARANGKG
jgi:hypothetical protein